MLAAAHLPNLELPPVSEVTTNDQSQKQRHHRTKRVGNNHS
jgi:hypothetical protein